MDLKWKSCQQSSEIVNRTDLQIESKQESSSRLLNDRDRRKDGQIVNAYDSIWLQSNTI